MVSLFSPIYIYVLHPAAKTAQPYGEGGETDKADQFVQMCIQLSYKGFDLWGADFTWESWTT